MKILYVGHHHENSGWGEVTRQTILALDHIGFDIVTRPIILGLYSDDIPDKIKTLDTKDSTNCDIIIQHVLPHYMQYSGHFKKNIGIFELESNRIQHTLWSKPLNLMDELWVPATSMLHIDGIDTQTKYVPHPINIEEYEKEYTKLNIQSLQNKFVFYFIGSFNRRKHLSALLRAFYAEFHKTEPVTLVIKTNRTGMSPKELGNEVLNLCNSIKQHLHMYDDIEKYPKETIITLDLPRNELLRLHASCDCLVSPSHGEAWNLPLIDAMGMQNLVISSTTGAMVDHISSGYNGFLVNGSMQPVFGEEDGAWGFGSARELEFNISILELQNTMRQVYQMEKYRQEQIRRAAKQTIQKYSYAIIGNRMKELLYV